MNGKVKFFNEGKGFGFIAAEDGKEYFVHISGLSNQDMRLNEEDSVTFDIEEGDRGLKAVNVKLGSSDDSPAEEPADDVEDSQEEDNE